MLGSLNEFQKMYNIVSGDKDDFACKPETKWPSSRNVLAWVQWVHEPVDHHLLHPQILRATALFFNLSQIY